MITVTRLAGPNAVLSGLFFDPQASPTPTPTATASLRQARHAPTQGNWIGAYGSQGYNVIGNATSYPAYATVTPPAKRLHLGRQHDRPPRPRDARAAPAASPPAGTRAPASRSTLT